MSVGFEVQEYLNDNPSARKIAEYLRRRTAASISLIASAIREKPEAFEQHVSDLLSYGLIQTMTAYAKEAPASSTWSSSYMLTEQGGEAASTITH